MTPSPFFTLDIETLALPGKTNLVAMPSFAFVHLGTTGEISVLYARLPVQEQLDYGSVVSASTLAFWASEIKKGNPASEAIIKSLRSNSAEYYIAVYNDLAEEESFPYYWNCKETTSFDVFNRVVPEFFKGLASGPVIGNGPEFDNAIFTAHFNSVAAVPLPWKFWESGSARTIKQLGKDKGMFLSYAALETTAGAIINNFALNTEFITQPHKHDPLFDALVETLMIKQVLASI